MLRVDYKTVYGSVKVKNHDGRICNVKIHWANCLCAFCYHYQREDGTKMVQLWNFLNDSQHAKSIIKNTTDHTLLGTSVVSVKLNVYYKEARQLIMPMAQSGYKVTCYYKEPKKKQL